MRLGLGERALPALQLDRADPGLLDQPGRVAQRLDRALLVRAEGQVRDDQRAAGAADHGRRQHRHVVHGDRDGGVVAQVAVAHRVADEQDGDAGVVEDRGGHRVVRGEHRPLLAALLGGGDVVHGDAAGTGGGAPVERFRVVGRCLGSGKLRHGDGSFMSSRGALTASPDRFHAGTGGRVRKGESLRTPSHPPGCPGPTRAGCPCAGPCLPRSTGWGLLRKGVPYQGRGELRAQPATGRWSGFRPQGAGPAGPARHRRGLSRSSSPRLRPGVPPAPLKTRRRPARGDPASGKRGPRRVKQGRVARGWGPCPGRKVRVGRGWGWAREGDVTLPTRPAQRHRVGVTITLVPCLNYASP